MSVKAITVFASALALLLPVAAPAGWTTLQPTRGISAGAYHTCAVTSVGAVSCLGWNEVGGLGNGTTVDSLVPVPVVGLSSGVVTVGSNYNHSCALLTSGSVKCWGRNSDGQLGDGTTTPRTTPVAVKKLPSVIGIGVGKDLGCAYSAAGSVYCWGRVTNKKVNLTAVQVKNLSRVASLAVGKGFACALTGGGTVKCWGKNNQGQLGNGGSTDSLTPVTVTGLSSGVLAISASGDFACALTSASSAKCWAENDHGQLGDGTTIQRHVPVAVQSPGTDLVAITVGANHACTLSRTSAVRCWGRNEYGELGNGTTVESHLAVDVLGLGGGVVAISAGASGHFVCALTDAGRVRCWGRNQYGQLGDGTKADKPLPVDSLMLP
jgi:alpha-tubulin suppressor-like RCC1 family protein